MSKWAGLLMIAAGVGGAAYVYPMLAAEDASERRLAEATSIATKGVSPGAPAVVASTPETTRTFSAETTPGRPSLVLQPRTPSVDLAPQAPAVVARPIEAPQPAPLKPLGTRSEDNGRATLARDIQRELRRVGCYRGEIDGAWSSETQQAMKTFIDRVNATLPIDEPDHILKTLVQGHPGSACGQNCPTGQALAGDGRCLPTAIIAQSGKKPQARETAALKSAPAATPPARSWETTIAAAAQPEPRAEVAAASPVQPPLPGRMGIGAAPVATPPAVTGAGQVVLRPKQRPVDGAVDGQPANRGPVVALAPTTEVKPDVPDAAVKDGVARPAVGAVRAAEPPLDPAARAQQPRRAATAPARPSSQASYQAPRPRFGPSIFKTMERDAR